MADEAHKLSPRHPLLKRAVTVTMADTTTQWVPVEVLEQVEHERAELARTMSLINAVYTFPSHARVDIARLLRRHGLGIEQARATVGILNWARGGREETDA